MGYYSAIKRNGFDSAEVWWVKLESVIQSEVNQEEKTNILYYCIYIEIYCIEKWFISTTGRNRDSVVENSCGTFTWR